MKTSKGEEVLHFFAKRFNELQKVKRDERGFTLIELLVVIIIIGILAAIAIPVFLAQRDRAQDAAAESDLRNMTSAATAWAADNNGSYAVPTGVVDSTHVLSTQYDFNSSDGVRTEILTSSADGYTAEAQFGTTGQVYTFDSATGTISP